MIEMPGKDNFKGWFDIFEWSAPVCETPEETLSRFNELDVCNKTIKDIRVIGAVWDSGLDAMKKLLIDSLKGEVVSENSGIPRSDDYDMFLVDDSALVSEPLAIEFTDGTSFEFMPCQDDQSRMSVNTIPREVEDGLNHNNFSLSKVLFKDCVGGRITGLEIRPESAFPANFQLDDDWKADWTTIRYEFSLLDRFDQKKDLVVGHIKYPFERYGNFAISLHDAGHFQPLKVQFSDMRESRKPISQLCLPLGATVGGTFRIGLMPEKDMNAERKFISSKQFHITLEDDDFTDLLSCFFISHYDPDIQDQRYHADKAYFDWYDINQFTFEDMKKVIADIRAWAALLQKREPFDDKKIKEWFSWQLGWLDGSVLDFYQLDDDETKNYDRF